MKTASPKKERALDWKIVFQKRWSCFPNDRGRAYAAKTCRIEQIDVPALAVVEGFAARAAWRRQMDGLKCGNAGITRR